MRRMHMVILASGLLVTLLVGVIPLSAASSAARQSTPAPEVYAEAIGQANLRGGPGVEYPVVGEIAAGTRYRVLARHTLVPWLRLDFPGHTGTSWVYADLVTVTGNLALVEQVAAFGTPVLPTATPAPATPSLTPSATPPAATAITTTDPGTPSATSAANGATSATPAATLTPSPTPTPDGPTVTTLGEANIRFGPDISYPVVANVPAGSTFRVLEVHALVTWLRIDLPESPTGDGWIFADIVAPNGDLSGLPRTSVQQVSFPTLTPTPQIVVVNTMPGASALPAGELAATLGNTLHTYLLDQGFIPFTNRFGAVFVLDLQTGDTFSLNDEIAFSGMSLTKIAILATFFKELRGPLTADDAFLIADTMMCSENITTNTLLARIGDGDALRGAQRVTMFLQGLDLRETFIMRQYRLLPDEPATGTGTLTTGADQASARPDLYNQIVPKDLGFLLAGIYQCAQNETGLLIERYPDDFDAQKCRKILRAMDANEIGVFLEAGVPQGTTVIHKHGWIEDTHGDAGIVIGPDGRAFVFVAALYGRDWLEFENSSPVLGDLARLTWNHFYPAAALDTITERVVPLECNAAEDPVMQALLAAELPMPR